VSMPLAVLIDDLDRCDKDYVVQLLEGIQTIFIRAPVTYVAAADRRWIEASFEERYEPFVQHLSEPARGLGYLFLEKAFQLSTTLPRIPPRIDFLTMLLQRPTRNDADRARYCTSHTTAW
jgi:hypothetical protein